MTNLEALSSITPFSANSQLFQKILIDLDIAENGTYLVTGKNEIDYASALACKYIVSNPNFSEGTLSVTYDKKELIKYANSIFSKLNKSEEKIITNTINFI